MTGKNNFKMEEQAVIRGREVRKIAVWDYSTWQIIHGLRIHLFSFCLELGKKYLLSTLLPW